MAKSNILIRSRLKQARSLVAENKLNEAIPLYQNLYTKNKSAHSIGLELAVIYRNLGQYAEAESISKNIINIAPKNAYAHHIHGSALQCLNQYDAAIEEYKLAIQLDGNLAEAHYFLGNLYQIVDQYELAAESYYQAIRVIPDYYEALNNLVATLVELRRPIEAKEMISRAEKINPNTIQLLCNISGYYLLENNMSKAMEYASKAYNMDPEFIDVLKLYGQISHLNGEYDKAIGYLNKAYNLSNDKSYLALIAQILERRGEFDEANRLITPFIEAGNPDVDALLTYSALSRKFKNEHLAIDAIETKIKKTTLNNTSLIRLHSELGKQYDFLNEYDKAFKNYETANLLEREENKQVAMNDETRSINNTNKADIEKWYRDYPKEFWQNLPTSGNTSKRPIFVIGMFRSGTTLCEQILSSHPEVHGAGELLDINKLSYVITRQGRLHDKSPAPLTDITQNQLRNAAESYLQTLDRHSTTATRVVDKMPANFAHVGLISKIFPNAYIVHMIRDPRDSCLSMYFQRFGSHNIFSTDLVELANYHLSYQEYMKYWREVLDIEIHDVVYENLTENQEAVTRGMLEYCELEWNENCMNFHKSKRDINTPSYDQVRKPMYKKSAARWKNYETHIEPLISALNLK